MTDSELLRLYTTEGSQAAFRDLVARHVDLVYSAALRQMRGRSHLAQDISQRVFTELARQAPRLTNHPSLRGWLFVCTRHVAARVRRAECRRLERETTAQTMNELMSGSGPEWESIRPVMDEVLCRLKDQDREALFLRFLDNLSFADLGARLGVGEDAARRRVDRVVDRVRRMLAQRGIKSTAAALSAVLATETVNAAPLDLAAGIAQVALGAVSTTPSAILVFLAFMKSIALSTAFIAMLALSGILAGGAGLYYQDLSDRDEAFARARAASIASAEGRLVQIKQRLAQSTSAEKSVWATSAAAKSPPAPRSLEDQIARDLELRRWEEQRNLARDVLKYGPFLMQHGISAAQVQQFFVLARNAFEDLDDLREVAQLAGVQIQSDPDLLAQAQKLEAQYKTDITAMVGVGPLSALSAYAASLQGPDQNSPRTWEADWVADQVAGVAFAAGSSLPIGQKAQITGSQGDAMNRRVVLLLMALAFLFSMVAYDAWLAMRIHASREAAGALGHRFAEIERQIGFQKRQDAHLSGNLTKQNVAGRLSVAGNAGRISASAANPGQDPRQLIAGDAMLRARYLANYRDGLNTQYGLFIHMLGLSPAEEAEFKQLMTDREANALQVAETAADAGLDPNSPEMKALSKQLNSADWTNLKQLLGPTGITELKQYWSEWPVVTLVQNFGGNLPEPTLTVVQAQQLLPVLSAASLRDSTGTVIPDTINVPLAVSAVAPILTPEQLLNLTAILQEAEAKAKINQLSKAP